MKPIMFQFLKRSAFLLLGGALSFEIASAIFLATIDARSTLSAKERTVGFGNTTSGLVLHPFFGFSIGESSSTNNHGFPGNSDLPYEPAGDEFVVGLFGGSVGGQVCRFEAEKGAIASAILERVQAKGYRKAKILCFSIYGWKQPQQLAAYLTYQESLDMSIFLDGFNEISQMYTETLDKYPVDFPISAFWNPLASSEPIEATRYRIRALTVKDQIKSIRVLNGSRRISWSSSVKAVSVVRIRRLENELDDLRQRYVAALSEHPSFARFIDRRAPASERIDRYLRSYRYWTDSIFRLATASGKLMFHFIQPNQYLDGSKQFTAEEQRSFRSDAKRKPVVSAYYPTLSAISQTLRKAGVPSFDLSRVFLDRGVTASVYSDSCCHFNETGLNVLVEEMVARILASESVEAIPVAHSRRRAVDKYVLSESDIARPVCDSIPSEASDYARICL